MRIAQIVKRLENSKPVWRGSAREAFYDKKSDLVFKRVILGEDRHTNFVNREQHNKEAMLYKHMTKEEREIFPIVAVYTDKNGEIWIVMRKVNRFPIGKCVEPYPREDFYRFCNENGFVNARQVVDCARKYNIADLYGDNVGYIKNKIVIIDCGL